MSKNYYKKVFYPLFFFLCIKIVSASSPTKASVITIPIEADLEKLTSYLNEKTPQLLSHQEDNRVCIKAQYLKTKGIPKCKLTKNCKLSCHSREIKLQLTPSVECNIQSWVERDGNILLSGENNILKIAFPLKAKVVVKSGISTTTHASGVLYVKLSPALNNDWSLDLNLSSQLVWKQEPTLNMMHSIDINIKNYIEPKLHQKIDTFIKNLPQHLAKLKIKTKLNSLWKEMQKPLALHTAKSQTYLLFHPHSAAYSGFHIKDNKLTTTIHAKGITKIIVGQPDKNCTKSKLCTLGLVEPTTGAFNFHLPILIPYEALIAISKKKSLDHHAITFIPTKVSGVVTVSHPSISKTKLDEIAISAHIAYDHASKWKAHHGILDGLHIDGNITFKAVPKIDKKRRVILFDKLDYHTTTNSLLLDMLVSTAQLSPIASYLSGIISYPFGDKIDEGVIKANSALKDVSKEEFNLSASFEKVSIEDIVVDEKHIIINTILSGKVKAQLTL